MQSINKFEHVLDQRGVHCRTFQSYNICVQFHRTSTLINLQNNTDVISLNCITIHTILIRNYFIFKLSRDIHIYIYIILNLNDQFTRIQIWLCE